ncbi:hypothetical protein [Mycobacterium avium]|uniref:hypothetical protein n=1 Tax=Mycobacterium avium TaxID=1764 RepID=UPI0007C7B4C7|nr:hypothetical protein [Mycobacterium avium]
MTTMTGTATTDQDAADGAPYWLCWDCGGPCLMFKGSVHGWRCQTCIDKYLEDGTARWLARARKEQEKLRAKHLAAMPPAMTDDNPTTSLTANPDRRQEGGARVMYRPSSGVGPATGESGEQRYVPRRSDDHHHQEGLT